VNRKLAARRDGMPSKALVLDANILVRAVLGKRVRDVIEMYAGQVSFFVPEVAYAEAEEHLPAVVVKHGGDLAKALKFLRSLIGFVELLEARFTVTLRATPTSG
jgi:predicted nucleic acid-binding protein